MKKPHSKVRIWLLVVKVAAGGLAPTAAAHAETSVSAYLGKADTGDADVGLSLPGGTDLTFQEVSWADESSTGPIFNGLRLAATQWREVGEELVPSRAGASPAPTLTTDEQSLSGYCSGSSRGGGSRQTSRPSVGSGLRRTSRQTV